MLIGTEIFFTCLSDLFAVIKTVSLYSARLSLLKFICALALLKINKMLVVII
jgi:hypothetical protein